MYSDSRSCSRRPDLHEVAYLIGDPQTVVVIGSGRATTDERIVDDSVIDDFADQVVRLTEDPDGAKVARR